MKRVTVPVTIVLAAVLSLTAAAETKAERGKRVVEEALAALGGDKFLSVKDRVESGRAYSFYREQLSGLAVASFYTQYLQTPPEGQLAQRERQAFGKDEDSAVIFANGQGWEVTFRGARPLQEDRLRRYHESTRKNIFYILQHRMNEPGLIIESQGSDIVDNQPVEAVDFIDSNNETVTVYFHRSTKLPVKQMFFRRDPQTKERFEEVTFFSKYRDVGGSQWPFTILRERDGEKIYQMFAEAVEVNKGLTDDLFTIGPKTPVLKPKR
jgi:hypothetical protein